MATLILNMKSNNSKHFFCKKDEETLSGYVEIKNTYK